MKLSEITPLDIASKVAPRLNSLGRIAEPNQGIEFACCREPVAAEALAKELEEHNQERQKIERKDSEDIDHFIIHHPEIFKKAIVLYSERWTAGIIPIITARIAKTIKNRPTLVIAIDDGIGKGSLRTISEFPLLTALKDNAELLMNFRGA